MWYVLRCRPGQEEIVLNSCRRHLSGNVCKEAFVFTYDRMKRFHGQWHIESARMFPDYIFLESDCEKELSGELEQYRGFVQIMEDKNILWQIYPEEEQFLRTLCGKGHHLSMSRGRIKDGVTFVEEGPLCGMENRIRKIERHKRIAKIEAPIRHTDAGSILAGLEIVEKS